MAWNPIDIGAGPNMPAGQQGTPWRECWNRVNQYNAETQSLQSRVISAADIRFDSQPTKEAKIQAAINQAALELATAVFIPAFMLPYDASLVTFNTAIRMVREGGDFTTYDVRAYGATGDGVADDTASFVAAIAPHAGSSVELNASGGGNVYCPLGTYLLTSDPFAPFSFVAPCRIEGAGMQSTVLKKGFNGTWFTFGINFGFYLRWENLTFDGQHDAGRTGTGFVYTGNSGGAGNDYHSYFRCRFVGIESHFSVGQDAAKHIAFLDCEAYPSVAQQGVGEYAFYTQTANDTGATHRRFTHSVFDFGTVDISGCLDIYMATVGIKRLHTSASTAEYFIASSFMGNSDGSHPLSGLGAIVGCRFAGDVVLHSSFTGSFVGNYQTAGTFTDNSAFGSATVVHHPLSQQYNFIGQKTTIRTPQSAVEMVQSSHIDTLPDADATLNVTSHRVVLFNNALAANRTISLSATGARAGDRFRVVRKGLGAFTMDVGGLKTIPSATAAFVDVEYTGSAWTLTGYGAL